MTTYNLRNAELNDNNFYHHLAMFTDAVLDTAEKKTDLITDNYYGWVKTNKIEAIRSKSEYTLELIMAGVFWHNYASKASNTGKFSKKVLATLYKMRKKYPRYKTQIDRIRGYLSYMLLEKRNLYRVEVFSLENFESLLQWLKATGEFNEEVLRLTNWLAYLQSKSRNEVSEILQTARNFAINFTNMGRSILGEYTKNVDSFRNNTRINYKYKEDYFFVQRHENEYFLNMFGAEIMNRELKAGFDATSRKALLMPTCMRKRRDTECNATMDGKGKVCAICDKQCNIGKTASEMKKEGHKVYLISHSSSFSKFLENWANQKEIGLVGVACVLNLLTGGYEMKRLNIPSQCVFLDYSGCKKHWNKDGIPTNLNRDQLKQMVTYKNELKAVF